MAYQDIIIADAPVAYWRLGDEATTNVATDSMAVANGSYSGFLVTERDVAGFIADDDGSVVGDGTDNYVGIGNVAALNTTLDNNNAVTFEAWIKPASTGTEMLIFASGADGNGYRFIVGRSAGLLGSMLSGARFQNAGALTVGQWHHVVMTYDGTTRKHYVDGVEVGSWVESFTLAFASQTLDLMRYGGFGSGYFNGGLDEVAIYSRALTAAEITEHYNAGLGATNATVFVGQVGAASATAPAPAVFIDNNDVFIQPPQATAAAVLAEPVIESFTTIAAEPATATASAPVPGVVIRAATYEELVLLSGPAFYSRFEEGTGTTTVDQIGNISGTLDTQYTEWSGPAAGTGDSGLYVGRVDYASAVNFDGVSSVELWVRFGFTVNTLTEADHKIKLHTPTSDSPSVTVAKNGDVVWTTTNSTTIAAETRTINVGSLADGNWHHIVVVRGSADMVFYRDGAQAGTTTLINGSDHHFNRIINTNAPSNAEIWVDELAVYTKALTATEVADHYNAGGDNAVAAPAATASVFAPAPSFGLGFSKFIPVGGPAVATVSVTDARLFIKHIDATASAPAPTLSLQRHASIAVGDPMAGAVAKLLEPSRVNANEIVHETNFSEYIAGSHVGMEPLANWRDAFGAAKWAGDTSGVDSYNATIVSDAAARGGKYLSFTNHELKWTLPGDAQGNLDDISILTKISANTSIILRGGYHVGGVSNTLEDVISEWRGYALISYLTYNSATAQHVRRFDLVKLKGTRSLTYNNWWYRDWDVLDTVDYTNVADDAWIWVRFEGEGEQVRARIWAPGESEPNYWLVAANDPAVPEEEYHWGYVSFAGRLDKDVTPPLYEPDTGPPNDKPFWGEARIDYLETTEPVIESGAGTVIGGSAKPSVPVAKATVKTTRHQAGSFNHGGGLYERDFSADTVGSFPANMSTKFSETASEYVVQAANTANDATDDEVLGGKYLRNAPGASGYHLGALSVDDLPSGMDFVPQGQVKDGEFLLKFRTTHKDRYGRIWLRASGEQFSENGYSIWFGRGDYGLPAAETYTDVFFEETEEGSGRFEQVEESFTIDPRNNPWLVEENAFIVTKHVNGVEYIGSNVPNALDPDGILVYAGPKRVGIEIGEWYCIRVSITNRSVRINNFPSYKADGSIERVTRYLDAAVILYRVWKATDDEPQSWRGGFMDWGNTLDPTMDAPEGTPPAAHPPFRDWGWWGFSGSNIGEGRQDFDLIQALVPDQPKIHRAVPLDNITLPYSPYETEVLGDQPVVWWRFGDESFSEQVNEKVYENQPGGSPFTIDAEVWPSVHDNTRRGQPGAIADGDYAIYFNGVGDQLVPTYDPIFAEDFNWQVNRDNSMSWEVWIKPDALKQQTIFRHGPDDAGYHLFMDSAGRLNSRIHYRDGAILRTAGQCVAGQWHHFVMSFDGDTGTRRHYLNGVEVGEWLDRSTDPLGNQALIEVFEDDFVIGAQPTVGAGGPVPYNPNQDNGGDWYAGYMDELALWSRSLSAAEVSDHYTSSQIAIIDPPDHTAGAKMYEAYKITVQRVDNAAGVTVAFPPPTLYVVNANRLAPVSDQLNESWVREDGTALNLYDSINEVETPDYADYIESPHNPVNNRARFGITAAATPGRLDEHRIRYAFHKLGHNGQSLRVILKSAGVEIAAWTHTDVLGDWIEAEQLLTETQAGSITNYADLAIEVIGGVL